MKIQQIFKDSFTSFEDSNFILSLIDCGYSETDAEKIHDELWSNHEGYLHRFGAWGDDAFWNDSSSIIEDLDKQYKIGA